MIKLLDDNIGKNLDDLQYGNGFLDNTIKGMIHEINTVNLEFMKIKNFYSAKDNIKRMR